MKFLFEVTETLSRTVEIEADSQAEAYQKGRAKYKNSEIVLDETDFVDVDFKTLEKTLIFDFRPFPTPAYLSLFKNARRPFSQPR